MEKIFKKCKGCGNIKPGENFHKWKDGEFGLGFICKECIKKYRKGPKAVLSHNKRQLRYYYKNKEKCRASSISWLKKQGPEYHRDRERRHYHKDIQKSRARVLLRTYVFEGKIFKPNICERCGIPSKKIDGHHFNGYDGENKLKVQWLCSKCHSEIHAKNKEHAT